MAHMVETMAYNKIETPWHGLGFPVSNDLTPEEMLQAAKLDWTVSKRVMWADGNGDLIVVPKQHALVRDSDNKILSIVGQDWNEVQNSSAFDFFSEFVKEGGMSMETAGSLWGGRYVWGLARINRDFTVGTADQINNYLLLMSPHIFGKSLIIDYTPVRVVCWNTLNFALGSKMKGSDRAFRQFHSKAFDESAKTVAKMALGLAIEQSTIFQEASVKLASRKATVEEVSEYFYSLLDFDPRKAEKNKDGTIRYPNTLAKFETNLENAPGQDIDTARGTWWGALNAVTYTVDHDLGRTRDTALKSAWTGQGSVMKRKALDLALVYAA